MSAGTTQDTSVRLVADRLTQSLGRSFIVDNMPGGRGLIAAQTAARAEPDGYTYFLGGVGVIASDRHLFKSLPYNPDRDFVPVAMIYDAAAFVVAVHPDLPAKSVPELITLAKSQPGKLSYGTGTVGVLAMPGLWFNKLAGTELVAVPYNNSAQMMQDAVAGRTQVLFTTIGAVEPFRRAEKLRVLGVSSIKRFPGSSSSASRMIGRRWKRASSARFASFLVGCRDGPRLLNETRSLADKIFIISNYYTPSPYVFMHKR